MVKLSQTEIQDKISERIGEVASWDMSVEQRTRIEELRVLRLLISQLYDEKEKQNETI